jgi:hypothetical protein
MTQRQAERLAWVVGALGLFGTVIGWSVAPAAFPYAWLAALTAWLGWPLGCLGLLLIHALTGGRWGYTLRPQFVAGMSTIWLLLPAAIPWAFALGDLYPWARPGGTEHLLNGFYLNLPFFTGRGILYLLAWIGLRTLVLKALQADDADAALARIAPGGLIVLALTITFSAIDLTMSLDPRFNSSVYGLIAMSEMGLFALSIAMLAAALSTTDGRTDGDLLATLGKLLLALVLLWAYLDFMQLLIVWQSDLAAEAPWYLQRSAGRWGVIAILVSAGHFVLPVCALIWPQVRRSRRGIAIVTTLLVLSEVLRTWWLVVPASSFGFDPVDVAAMIGLLGVGAALTLRQSRRAPPLPTAVATAGEHSG